MRFENNVAVITGGGGYLGSFIANKLASEGAAVTVCDIVLENAQKVADEINANNGKAIAMQADVQDSGRANEVVENTISKFGKVDILVNCAGGSARSRAKELCWQTDEVIRDVIGMNLMGAIYYARAVSKNMIENKRGKIISLSSAIGINGKRGFVDYAAAKAGIIGMTKSLAIELGKYGVCVNCVSPGIVRRPDDSNDYCHTNFLERNGTADGVADLITFLASDEASFITGQNYIIDGGRTIGLRGDK